MAEYDRFVFFPQTLESFCRVVVEARMLQCKLSTNNLNGCTYEPWFTQYKGEELINFIDEQKKGDQDNKSEEKNADGSVEADKDVKPKEKAKKVTNKKPKTTNKKTK